MAFQILLLLEFFPTFITLVDILWPLTAHLWSSILVLHALGFLVNIIPIVIWLLWAMASTTSVLTLFWSPPPAPWGTVSVFLGISPVVLEWI